MPALPAASLSPDDPRLVDERLRIGASWYPEVWPEGEWAGDVAKMREVGFNVTRLFEFAWHRFEPGEGEYDFEWARRVMDLCHEHGIGVILGTPTAAPPAWLTSKYPDVLRHDPPGRPARHGQRKHGSHLSPRYRTYCRRIVEQMVEHLGDHPAAMAWQIDNEMGGADYSEAARSMFHDWLRERFGSVEHMNESWGLEFWSQAYGSFDQVPLPTASVGSIEVPERHHPSLIIAAATFQSEGWRAFIASQCDAIREYSDLPITTNMAGHGLGSIDWFDANREVDRVGYSIYADVPHYPWRVMHLDRMRAEKPIPERTEGAGSYRPYWLLETAPNWSGGGKQWNIHHNAAGMRAFAWLTTLLGGSMVLFWQWRSHRAGQEMQHGTCVSATGKWRPNKEAWAALAAEYEEHGRWLLEHPPTQAEVAMVLSTQAAWGFSIDPIDDDMKYETRWRDASFLPLVRRHIWRDVIGTDAASGDSLDRYKVLCVPHLPTVPEAMRERLRSWVEAGGRLLLGPLTGYRSEAFTAFTDRELGGLEQLIGAGVGLEFSAHWREGQVAVEFDWAAVLSAGDTATEVAAPVAATTTRAWCQAFDTESAQAIPIARYHAPGEYGHDRTAAVLHTLGRGRVLTLGCMIAPALYATLVELLLRDTGGSPSAQGDADILIAPRGATSQAIRGYGLVNLAEDGPRTITLPSPGTDRLTGRRVGPGVTLDPLEVMLIELD